MKVAIYSPYLDTLGGGERYMMTIAEFLSINHEVDVLLDAHLYSLDIEKIIQAISERFNLNLKKINLVKGPFGKDSNFLSRYFFLNKYDTLFYLTDGSFFYPSATKNILHIQSPIIGQSISGIKGKIKLSGWDLVIYNSNFTWKNSKNFWKIKSKVIYPPVDIDEIKPLKKENLILSVGRFFGFLKDKKHEILIKAFIDLYKNKQLKGWSLCLAGAANKGDEVYLEELKKMARGYPIKFYPNLDYNELIRIYGKASIYWHAAGFGEVEPTKMEHFGISTVEAMAGGCVPVVINKGGQTEIVENNKTGFLWNSVKNLEEFTLKLINDENLRSSLSQAAILSSHKFSKARFEKEILDTIK